MQPVKLIAAAFLIISGAASDVQATNLDELYRDIIRSDNSGYLPLFVKNRHAPNILLEEDDLNGFRENPDSAFNNSGIVNLSSSYESGLALAKARQLQWLKTVAAVKTNQVTPFELNDITSRVEENDPKATEILAWMYAKGVGVSADFIASFNLYKKAARLNVKNAEKNALLVYRAMNDEQRKQIKNSSTLPQPL